jgi:NAD(P)-dependent dehydrogenase (short-subunit alcohol dehydrogenase family)
MKLFNGRTAVITGAGSGFGRAFALAATSLGMNVVLSDIQRAPLDETVSLLKAAGVTDARIAHVTGDVAQEADMQALADLTRARFGAPHLVFNNAGVGSGGLVWENSVKDWEWVLGVNVWGVIHGVRLFTPMMLAAAKADAHYEGHIVNTASMAGLLSPQLMGAYNVSKHAVVALSETLYHDLSSVQTTESGQGKRQVSCSVLCPAFVPTGISQSHRARPETLQNTAPPTDSMRLAQSMTHKAVMSGKLSAEDVARITFQAIAEDRFYILTHPKIMETVKLRLEDIAGLSNPRDPFSTRESLRPKLVTPSAD